MSRQPITFVLLALSTLLFVPVVHAAVLFESEWNTSLSVNKPENTAANEWPTKDGGY